MLLDPAAFPCSDSALVLLLVVSSSLAMIVLVLSWTIPSLHGVFGIAPGNYIMPGRTFSFYVSLFLWRVMIGFPGGAPFPWPGRGLL